VAPGKRRETLDKVGTGASGAGSGSCSYSPLQSRSKSKSFPRPCWGKKAAQRVATQGKTWAARALYIAPYQRPLTPALSRREREPQASWRVRVQIGSPSPCGRRYSLSPRERAGVRGPAKRQPVGRSFRVKGKSKMKPTSHRGHTLEVSVKRQILHPGRRWVELLGYIPIIPHPSIK